jgi:hypothetical protein
MSSNILSFITDRIFHLLCAKIESFERGKKSAASTYDGLSNFYVALSILMFKVSVRNRSVAGNNESGDRVRGNGEIVSKATKCLLETRWTVHAEGRMQF